MLLAPPIVPGQYPPVCPRYSLGRDKALGKMTHLVIVVSCHSQRIFDRVKEGDLRIGVVAADHEDHTMCQDQEVEQGSP